MPQNDCLKPLLDRAWEDKPLADILQAPVSVLEGVSKADAEALQAAFGVRTVADLAKCKPFLAAQAIALLETFQR